MARDWPWRLRPLEPLPPDNPLNELCCALFDAATGAALWAMFRRYAGLPLTVGYGVQNVDITKSYRLRFPQIEVAELIEILERRHP